MTTGIVQFRQSDAELAFLRAKGINPNEMAREAFEHALNLLHAGERYERLRQLRFKFNESPESLIRRERGSH